MALSLLLNIPDLPRFDSTTPCEWTLLDNANAILREGEGPLAALPRADRVVALAPVGHLLFIETTLPPVAPAKRDALLRYAIEDKLTIDPSTVHAVVVGKYDAGVAGGKSDSARHVVAAIDRTWLVGVLQWLKQAGLPPDSLISSAAGIPVAAGEWVVVLDEERGFAKRADGFVYNLDIGAAREPPFGLVLALKEARELERAPTALVLQAMPSRSLSTPADSVLAGQWQAALGVPVRLGTAPANNLHFLLAAGKSANLLTGEFAPREAAGKSMALLKPALIALALIVSAQVFFTLIDNWRLNGERQALEQEMTQVFKTAFPAAQAIIDPPLQMRRNLQQLKRERGIPADADAQRLIARLASLVQAVPGGAVSVTALTVRDGAATLDAMLAGADQRAILQRAIDSLPGAALGPAPGLALSKIVAIAAGGDSTIAAAGGSIIAAAGGSTIAAAGGSTIAAARGSYHLAGGNVNTLVSLRSRLTGSLAPLLQRWHRLNTRQQRVLFGAALLLAVAWLFAYVWLPAVRERERLIARLPQLSAQLALMHKQADEIRQLNSTSLITPAPPAFADSATLQSAFGEGARASVDPGRAWRIVIPRIAYATWWDRLGDVQVRYQLHIASLSLQALPGNNRQVTVDMLLADRLQVTATPASGASK